MDDPTRQTGTTTPARGTPDGEDVAASAFLSPRVIDEATLTEYAESFRALLGEVAGGRETLVAAVADAERVVGALTDTAARAGEKLRPAAKLLPAIDEKLRRAEEALKAATEAVEIGRSTEMESARADVASALRDAQTTIGNAIARARGIEGTLRQVVERADMAVQALDNECETKLTAVSTRANTLIEGLVERLEKEAGAATERLSAAIEERRAAAEAAEAALSDTIEIGAHDEPETGPVSATDSTGHAEALEQIESAEARAEALERAARDAEVRLESAEARLREIDRRGREIADGASRALAMFDQELSARVRTMQQVMAHTPGEARTTEVKPESRGFVRIDRPAT